VTHLARFRFEINIAYLVNIYYEATVHSSHTKIYYNTLGDDDQNIFTVSPEFHLFALISNRSKYFTYSTVYTLCYVVFAITLVELHTHNERISN
jgi:hypothetical protein